jgi:hypothetical protein
MPYPDSSCTSSYGPDTRCAGSEGNQSCWTVEGFDCPDGCYYFCDSATGIDLCQKSSCGTKPTQYGTGSCPKPAVPDNLLADQKWLKNCVGAGSTCDDIENFCRNDFGSDYAYTGKDTDDGCAPFFAQHVCGKGTEDACCTGAIDSKFCNAYGDCAHYWGQQLQACLHGTKTVDGKGAPESCSTYCDPLVRKYCVGGNNQSDPACGCYFHPKDSPQCRNPYVAYRPHDYC